MLLRMNEEEKHVNEKEHKSLVLKRVLKSAFFIVQRISKRNKSSRHDSI